MLHKYQFSPFDLMCHFRLLFSLLILCLDDLSIAVIEVLKFPMITVLLSTFPFMTLRIFGLFVEVFLCWLHLYLQLLYLLLGLIP